MSEDNNQIVLLREILKWIKISGIKEVKSLLETQMQDDAKKLIYQLSDGTKGIREIAKIAGDLSPSTVSNYWKQWENIGLGESVGVKRGGRFKRSFDLQDFGIIIQIPKQTTSQKSEPSELQNLQTGIESYE